MSALSFPEVGSLTAEAWHSLANGEIDGLVIPDWASEAECAMCADAALGQRPGTVPPRDRGGYKLPPSIGYAARGPAQLARYLASANAIVTATRDAFGGRATPMDRLFLRLAEVHPPGIRIPRMHNQRFASQHFRSWSAPGLTPPHIDACTTPALDFGITRRLAVNIYAKVSDSGSGALELYGKIDDVENRRRERRPENPAGYSLDRAELGEPMTVIHPRRGSAILFDASTIVHGVSALAEGESRVTLAAFLGFVDPDRALLIFA